MDPGPTQASYLANPQRGRIKLCRVQNPGQQPTSQDADMDPQISMRPFGRRPPRTEIRSKFWIHFCILTVGAPQGYFLNTNLFVIFGPGPPAAASGGGPQKKQLNHPYFGCMFGSSLWGSRGLFSKPYGPFLGSGPPPGVRRHAALPINRWQNYCLA